MPRPARRTIHPAKTIATRTMTVPLGLATRSECKLPTRLSRGSIAAAIWSRNRTSWAAGNKKASQITRLLAVELTNEMFGSHDRAQQVPIRVLLATAFAMELGVVGAIGLLAIIWLMAMKPF